MAAKVQGNTRLSDMPEDVVAAAESKQTLKRQFFIIFAVLSFSQVWTLIETPSSHLEKAKQVGIKTG